MNIELSNTDPSASAQPGAGASLSGELNAADGGPANPSPGSGVNPNPVNPAAAADAAAKTELDNIINESTFEARYNNATREIQRLNEGNRLSQEQLRDMADTYKVTKDQLSDVTNRLQRMRDAMEASVKSGEVLPASERLAFERTESEWQAKKIELENKVSGMARKVQAHQTAEAELNSQFVANVRSDTLNVAKKYAGLVDGNQHTLYGILKNEIIPQIDAQAPHLVDSYRRGQISLEDLCVPYIKRDLSFYKQVYSSRTGGGVDTAAAEPAKKAPSNSFKSFSGFL